jgi:hypothetical protein
MVLVLKIKKGISKGICNTQWSCMQIKSVCSSIFLLEVYMKQDAGKGLTFLEMLTLIFITLRLCRVIDWSWWWVLSPLWMPLCVVIFLVIIGMIIGGDDRG